MTLWKGGCEWVAIRFLRSFFVLVFEQTFKFPDTTQPATTKETHVSP
jgi:hypothetical protein